MKTYLYFVRHAISPFSLDTERARGLSEQGAADAIQIADLLAEEGIDVVVSSPYARAIDTVRPLAERLNKEISMYEELIERPIASLRYEISEEELLEGIERSFRDVDFTMMEGESTRQAQKRAIPVIKQLLTEHRGRKIAIGTHGNIMTIILHYFDKRYGFDFWKRTSKPDIYKVEFEELSLTGIQRLWQ